MAFIGAKPTNVPLTANDITDGSISVAKLTSTLDLSSNTVTLPSGVGGKVLQVVTDTDSTQRNSSSTSFINFSNALSVDITPLATSSKIFVTTTFTAYNNVAGKSSGFTIFRDSTDLGNGIWGMVNIWDETNRTIGAPMCLSVLDSPSSTSQLTYSLYGKTETGGVVYINYDSIKASLTAFEIAG